MASALRSAAMVLTVCGLGLAAGRASGQDAAALQANSAPAGAIWLDSLDLSPIEQGWGEPHAGRSVDDRPLRIHGTTFAHGVGTHAASEMRIDLKGSAVRFVSMVGVDDEVGDSGSVVFEVYVDGKKAAASGVLKGGQAPQMLTADLAGAKQLVLVVTDGGDGMNFDHADWAGAAIFLAPAPRRGPKPLPSPRRLRRPSSTSRAPCRRSTARGSPAARPAGRSSSSSPRPAKSRWRSRRRTCRKGSRSIRRRASSPARSSSRARPWSS